MSNDKSNPVGLFGAFSSMLAGFHVTLSVTGYIGFGALATWVIERWVPFTRFVWDKIANSIKDLIHIELSNAEKDSLTGVAFFSPMALWAFIRYVRRQKEKVAKEVKSCSYLAGIFFIVVMAQPVLMDCIVAVSSVIKPILNLPGSKHIYIIVGPIFFSSVIALMVISFLYFISIIFTLLIGGLSLSSLPEGNIFEGMSFDVLSSIIKTTSVIFLIIFSFFIVVAIFFGFSDIGAIRSFAVFIVVVMIWFAINITPLRLFVTLGSTLAFLLSSVAYEAVLFLACGINEHSFERCEFFPTARQITGRN